jgi:hypothetical protein
MRSLAVGAPALVGLLVAGAARAEDPCAVDVKQFCADVEIGRGRVQDCLRQNEARLSAACRDKRAAVELRLRQRVEQFAAACRRDADRLCSEVKPGGGRVIACLTRQEDDVTGSCRPELERIHAAGETISAMRTACTADAERLCSGALPEVGSLVDCLQANRNNLSQTCRSVDPSAALAAAELVDAVDALKSEARVQEVLQILQGIESIAFSRSQVLLQVDSYQGFGGSANADRLLLNPQVVFGRRHEFAIQLKAPVFAVYPYAPDRPAQTGLGAVTTAFAWAFSSSTQVHQYLSVGLQWISPVRPPVGAAWAVTPGYAVSVGLARALSVTGQLAWVRSFASGGYPDLNLLLFDPIVVLGLPGRSFVAVDTKLGWNFVGGSFLPTMKGVVGFYVDRRRSLSISAWYQKTFTREAEAQLFTFGVGFGMAYFFDW